MPRLKHRDTITAGDGLEYLQTAIHVMAWRSVYHCNRRGIAKPFYRADEFRQPRVLGIKDGRVEQVAGDGYHVDAVRDGKLLRASQGRQGLVRAVLAEMNIRNMQDFHTSTPFCLSQLRRRLIMLPRLSTVALESSSSACAML